MNYSGIFPFHIIIFHLYFQICVNWANFIDSESDLSHYMISVGTQPDKSVIDIVNLTQYDSNVNQACLSPVVNLQHGKTYYTTVWAFNKATKQQNVSKTSDGGKF